MDRYYKFPSLKEFRFIKPYKQYQVGTLLRHIPSITTYYDHKTNPSTRIDRYETYDLINNHSLPCSENKSARKVKELFLRGYLEITNESDKKEYNKKVNNMNEDLIVVKPFKPLEIGEVLKYNSIAGEYQLKGFRVNNMNPASPYTWSEVIDLTMPITEAKNRIRSGYLQPVSEIEKTTSQFEFDSFKKYHNLYKDSEEMLAQIRHFLNTSILRYSGNINKLESGTFDNNLSNIEIANGIAVTESLRVLCIAIRGILDGKTKVNSVGDIVNNE